MPLNYSNTSILTKVLKSNTNPIIINGNNHYKAKDFVVLDGIVSESIYKDIINICYKDNIDFKTYCIDNNLSLNNEYSIPFSFGNLTSLDYYDFNNKLSPSIST